MSPLSHTLVAFLGLAGSLSAQIYADFTVSTGTPPATTPLGTFRARLDHDKAPRPVANFIGLATGQRPWIDINTGAIRHTPYYDGQIFHRLIHSFVIQGGDILGTGGGGPGFVIQDQYHADLRHSGRYILSMAKSNFPNSNGSQFFITLRATPELDDKHSVFGEVITNTALIDDFTDDTLFPTNGEKPVTQINLDSVIISGPDLAGFDLFDPSLMLPSVQPQRVRPFYDPDIDVFTLTYDRTPQSRYHLATSPTIPALSTLAYFYSADSETDYGINISGVATPNFFARITKIDYGLLPDAPSDVADTGHTLVFSDRSGNTITLTFTSPTTGTWLHSDTSSGTFTVTSAFDYVPAAGAGNDTGVDRHIKLPLYNLALTFDAPGGPNGWTSINVKLSFHDPSSGWVEGTRPIPTFPFTASVLQSFTYTP